MLTIFILSLVLLASHMVAAVFLKANTFVGTGIITAISIVSSEDLGFTPLGLLLLFIGGVTFVINLINYENNK